MNLREKYGQWGIILGATEGVGKAFCEKIASGGMNVVMVGRREEMLKELGKEISDKYGVEHLVIKADFADSRSVDKIFEQTRELDMGFMSYVACFITFLKCFYHYMGIFSKQDRGAVINVASLTGISSSPYNAQYGAGKSYILKLTEAVACEAAKTNVDVEVITLGTTITPSLLKNLPGGPAGEAVMKSALTPEECVNEAFENLGKTFSVIAGEHNKKNVQDWKANHTADEYITYMGSFYEK